MTEPSRGGAGRRAELRVAAGVADDPRGECGVTADRSDGPCPPAEVARR